MGAFRLLLCLFDTAETDKAKILAVSLYWGYAMCVIVIGLLPLLVFDIDKDEVRSWAMVCTGLLLVGVMLSPAISLILFLLLWVFHNKGLGL